MTGFRAAVSCMVAVAAVDVGTSEAWSFALCDGGMCSIDVARAAAAVMGVAAVTALWRRCLWRRHFGLMFVCVRVIMTRDALAAHYGDAYLSQLCLLAAVLPMPQCSECARRGGVVPPESGSGALAASRVPDATGPESGSGAIAASRVPDATGPESGSGALAAPRVPDATGRFAWLTVHATAGTLVGLPYVITACAKGEEWWNGRALALVAAAAGGGRAFSAAALASVLPRALAAVSALVVSAQFVCGVVLVAVPFAELALGRPCGAARGFAVGGLALFHAGLLLLVPQVGFIPLCFMCGLVCCAPQSWLPVALGAATVRARAPGVVALAALGAVFVMAWAAGLSRGGLAAGLGVPRSSCPAYADALGLCNVRLRRRGGRGWKGATLTARVRRTGPCLRPRRPRTCTGSLWPRPLMAATRVA